MARIVFSGMFDRFPEMMIITHHLGAMIPYFEGRVGPPLGPVRDAHLGRGLQRDPCRHKAKGRRPIDYFISGCSTTILQSVERVQ